MCYNAENMKKTHKKYGKLIDHGVKLKPHELATVEYFLRRGDDIELVVPTNTLGNKNPDWALWGKIWEAKSPQTINANTLIVMLKRASKQSVNLIIDLRRIKGDEVKVMKIIQAKFETSKRLKHVLMILKDAELLELKKG